MKPLITCDDVENLGPIEMPDATPGWQAKVWIYFVRAIIIAAGAFLGAILALIIGLFTGWIEILC